MTLTASHFEKRLGVLVVRPNQGNRIVQQLFVEGTCVRIGHRLVLETVRQT